MGTTRGNTEARTQLVYTHPNTSSHPETQLAVDTHTTGRSTHGSQLLRLTHTLRGDSTLEHPITDP